MGDSFGVFTIFKVEMSLSNYIFGHIHEKTLPKLLNFKYKNCKFEESVV